MKRTRADTVSVLHLAHCNICGAARAKHHFTDYLLIKYATLRPIHTLIVSVFLTPSGLQNLDDSDWTNSLYPSPLSGLGLGDTSFTDDINMSSVMLKEEDPGEAGQIDLFSPQQFHFPGVPARSENQHV